MAAPKENEYWRMRINVGPPRVFGNPEELAEVLNAYFEWIEENPIKETQLIKYKTFSGDEAVKVFKRPIPRAMTIQGFCAFAGIASKTLYEYEKLQGFSEIIARAREIFYGQKIEGAAAGIFNASIIARELGLADKSEQKVIQDQPIFGDDEKDG